jgi:single-stranded-DNA-specific exonuclease
MKKYRVRERAHEDLIPDLLHARGVTDDDAIAHFLEPDFDRDSHDPFLLPDMQKSVDRILLAKAKGEKVAVWSDYDCDGIPGGVLLTEFLRDIGLSVRHYIPHRHKEGYGLNTAGLAELKEEGVTLVMTVDLGTTEHESILFANEQGIDVIVTDHHLVGTKQKLPPQTVWPEDRLKTVEGDPRTFAGEVFAEEIAPNLPPTLDLPPAFAVINPKRPDSAYPFDGLCGAGVAWKLVQGVLQKMRADGTAGNYILGREKWLLDLVGLGTMSDMVPLVGENRMLARCGLLVMRRNRRPGLAALLALLRIKPGALTEDDIGFMIAPRINAASRMGSPESAAMLLRSQTIEEAKEHARVLNAINDERKGVVASTVKEVNKRLTSVNAEAPVIVMGSPNWRPGILGLVANSLMQTHGKPVFLWGREGGEVLRGSCRSDGRVSVVALMQHAEDLFAHYGGHTASGGFSLDEARVHELAPRLAQACEVLLASVAQEPEVMVDRQLDLAEVWQAHRQLPKLAPFGIDNAKPLFIFSGLIISKLKVFGKNKDHLELSLSQGAASAMGIAFFSTPESFQKPLVEGMRADVVGHVEMDWRGGPRVRVVDVL